MAVAHFGWLATILWIILGSIFLGVTAVVLVALAGYMVVEGVRVIRGLGRKTAEG